ncbi:hypothetical protein [Bradyrhizobium sp. HKCCYLRH1030]|uniref:hypothetical protein n=1 Tax=Bradyrhizobium sp. HKCCYLRH1030 TaxID=3420744 RepID=UPI003EB7EDDA
MKSPVLVSWPAVACILLPGCVQTPPSDGMASVPVHEVVRRLKCELVDAIRLKVTEDNRFGFLTQWSAKVHLTLVVDDQTSINPGATFIEPLKIAGTNRSLAVGGGLTTQAVRTEDMEFFMSFPEVLKEMSNDRIWSMTYANCSRYPGILLESELGLKAVIDKALAPVGAGVLYTGVNNPGLGTGQPKVPAGEIKNIDTALNNLKAIDRLPRPGLSEPELAQTSAGQKSQSLEFSIKRLGEAKEKTEQQLKELQDQIQEQKTLKDNLAKAKQLEINSKMLIQEVVTPLSDIAANSIADKCLAGVKAERLAAVTSASVVAVKKYGVDNAQDGKTSTEFLNGEQAAATDTFTHADNMLRQIKNCGPREKPKPALYDPLDVIGETVNFYVTATGSVTPSWKLVRITAPLAPTFISGTRKDTNTLIIAMGRPNTSGDIPKSSEAMNQQVLAQILSQAITTRINQQ